MWKLFGSSAGHHGDTTAVASGAVIVGTVTFSGVLEIEGRIEGDVIAADDDRAVVRILQSGQVKGNVRAPLIVVNGTVTGNIHSTDHIELAANAVVTGDVHYNLIEMVKGAQINGGLVFNKEAPQPAAAERTEPAEESWQADLSDRIVD
jgi:cytoskeletal protein CcmA (bactofilin family)